MVSARSAWLTVPLLFTAASAAGQQWSAEAAVGRFRPAGEAAALQTQSALLGVRYQDPTTVLRLSAGVPTGSDAPFWGALAASKRMVARSNRLLGGIDVLGSGLLLHDRAERVREIPGLLGPRFETVPAQSGFAAALQLMPVLGFENTRLQAHLRAGLFAYREALGENRYDRSLPMADLHVTFAPTSAFALQPMARHYRAREDNYTLVGLTALGARGPASASASIGQWLGSDAATQWSLAGTLQAHHRIDLTASLRHDSFDPLHQSPAHTAWTIGAAVRLGPAVTPRAPVPANYRNGQATIRLSSAPAAAVRIAGDFNGWKPASMQRAGDDWVYTIPLAPGVYKFAFVDDRDSWFVPERYPGRQDDGMGGHVAVLVVQ